MISGDDNDPVEKRLQATKDRLAKKCPEKASAQGEFLADAYVCATLHLPPGADGVDRQIAARQVVTTHHTEFNILSSEAQNTYEQKRRERVAENRKQLDADKEHADAALRLYRERKTKEAAEGGWKFRTTTWKYDERDHHVLDMMWEGSRFNAREVAALRDAAVMPPVGPPFPCREVMESYSIRDASTLTVLKGPPWLRKIALARDILHRTVMMVTWPSDRTFYAFLYATQQPTGVGFMEINKVDEIPYDEDIPAEEQWGNGCHRWDFEVPFGLFTYDDAFINTIETQVRFIPQVYHTRRGWAFSDIKIQHLCRIVGAFQGRVGYSK